MAAQNGITTTTGAPSPLAAAPNPIINFAPIIVVGAILYFFLFRPQIKQSKDHKRMVDNLKSGDRVLTQGGIYGTVSTLKGNIVILKIADNVKVEVNRSAIAQVNVDAGNGTGVVTQGHPAS